MNPLRGNLRGNFASGGGQRKMQVGSSASSVGFKSSLFFCPCVASQVSTFIACDGARLLGILLGSNSCVATHRFDTSRAVRGESPAPTRFAQRRGPTMTAPPMVEARLESLQLPARLAASWAIIPGRGRNSDGADGSAVVGGTAPIANGRQANKLSKVDKATFLSGRSLH